MQPSERDLTGTAIVVITAGIVGAAAAMAYMARTMRFEAQRAAVEHHRIHQREREEVF